MKMFRRKNYFIKKGFQTRFMVRFIAASLAVNVLSVGTFIVLARNKIDDILFSMRLPSSGATALLSREALYVSIAAVVALSIVYLLAARSMYHRIAGPLQRIKTDMLRISSGDLSCRVTLRETDEFKDFADEINTMAEGLGRRYAGMKHSADELAVSARTLDAATTPGEAQTQMEHIKNGLRSLKDQLGAMKV